MSVAKHTRREIGRLADGIFRSSLPGRWAVRSQQDQEDFGVDYEIELTSATDEATGFIFKVQQKGSERVQRLADGTVSFNRLEVDKVTYYLRQLRIPIILVVVEVSTKTSWWVPLHGNRQLEAALATALAAKQKTVTVHLPAANALTLTPDAVLVAVDRMKSALTLDGLKTMPPADVAAAIAAESDLDELERQLDVTKALVRSNRTQRYIEAGELEEAFKLNKQAFESASEPAESRFAAGMEMVRVAGSMIVGSRDERDREALLTLRLQVTHDLVGVCWPLATDHQLRTYSLFLARTARLRVLSNRDVGLFFSRLAQGQHGDAYARYMTADAQRDSRRAVIRELRFAQRLLVKLVDRGWLGLVVYAWAELTEAVHEFITCLKLADLPDGAAEIRTWLDQVGGVCRDVASQLGDVALIEVAAVNHVRIALDAGPDVVAIRRTEALALISTIGDSAARQAAEAKVEQLTTLVDRPDEEPAVDEQAVEQVVRRMARGLGMNLDDPNDEIAATIRVGVRDYNPERVLRNCTQLLVQLGACGIPAQMLDLPTAGTKFLSCKKHRYRSGGWELDRLYELFKGEHCEGCPNREPHPPGWKWSRAYQKADEEEAERVGFGTPRWF